MFVFLKETKYHNHFNVIFHYSFGRTHLKPNDRQVVSTIRERKTLPNFPK